MSDFRYRLASSTMLASFLLAAPLAAQEQVPDRSEPSDISDGTNVPSEEIVVTGTLLRRPDLELASPVSVIASEEMSLRQASVVEELIRDLPAARPSIGSAVNNGAFGPAIADLRGLNNPANIDPEFQSNRTLILLDGNRIVPIGTAGLSDLNNIPIALIDRIDVVTGGASSTYGADAVAGVINFVTKRNFSGLQVDLQNRITEEGDGYGMRADLTLGANLDDGRGNVVLSIGYNKADPVLQGARPYGFFQKSSANGANSGSATAIPIVILANNARLPSGTSQLDIATGSLRAYYAPFNFNPVNYYLSPSEKFNLYAAGHYDLTDNIEAFASGMFVRTTIETQSASTGSFLSSFDLPLSNPYLPAGVRNQLCVDSGIAQPTCDAAALATGPGDPNYRQVRYALGRRITEAGTRITDFTTDMLQLNAGLRGSVFGDWKWSVSGLYGESVASRSQYNFGSFSRLQQALLASNANQCHNSSNGCVPINLFGPEGSITPGMVVFFNVPAFLRTTSTLKVAKADINGGLFATPWATNEIAIAVGAEYREQTARRAPDALTAIPGEVLGAGSGVPPQGGSYSVKEVFAELNAPLVEDRPFMESLTLEAGIRVSSYDIPGDAQAPANSFTTTTWKAGASWEPGLGLKFRAMYQIASRAPNINELFAPRNTLLNALQVDPCTGSSGQLLALCLATGARQGANTPPPSANQINVTSSGNRALSAEEARTITAGFVFAPRDFLSGLSLTVDYYDIKITDLIASPTVTDVLNGCYTAGFNPTYDPTNFFCQLVLRNPDNGSLNGSVANTPGVVLGISNEGKLKTRGVDFGFNYRLSLDKLGIGGDRSMTFSLTGNYLDTYEFQPFPIFAARECKGFYSSACGAPRPEWRWSLRGTYQDGPFAGSLRWNHLSAVTIEPGTSNIFEAYRRIPAYDLFDLALRWEADERLTFVVTVNNLLDKKPPIVGNTITVPSQNSGNTFPSVYDAVGRTYVVGATLKL